ncbi:hypothetical protein V6255_17000 [Psychromonas arctica]|uniref:Uncharacterized protein n=1 Tax=Psychromonas arctica TaxID=168275 RepID=A0ABU9HG54_9GAMM
MGICNQKYFFGKLYQGHFGLAKTVWLYGVLVNITYLITVNIFNLFKTNTTPQELILFTLLALAYNLIYMSGAWEAAEKYQGRHLWVALTKCLLIIEYFIWAIGFFILIEMLLEL